MEYYSALIRKENLKKKKKERKKENIVICDNIDEFRQHYVKWNKPGRERQLMHGITYMWNLKEITHRNID